MNKRFITLLCAVFICVASAFSTFAASNELPRYVDQADIVDDSLDVQLLEKLNEVSERQQFDVVIITVDTLDGNTAEEMADYFYDNFGFGYGDTLDGCLLLIAKEEREWHISTAGFGITALTDAGIEYIGEQMLPDLSDGDYYSAFSTYAELCDDFLTQAYNGTPFDIDSLPKSPFNFFASLLIALGVGVVVAFVVVMIMKSQLKSVRFKSAAANYVKSGSMIVTQAQEFFLYRHVNRQKKAENHSGGSSTHVSSSGTTHGGGGGRF